MKNVLNGFRPKTEKKHHLNKKINDVMANEKPDFIFLQL